MHLTKTFVAIFALAERLPTSATLSKPPPRLSKKLQRLSHVFCDRIKFHAKKMFPNVAADRMFPWMKIFGWVIKTCFLDVDITAMTSSNVGHRSVSLKFDFDLTICRKLNPPSAKISFVFSYICKTYCMIYLIKQNIRNDLPTWTAVVGETESQVDSSLPEPPLLGSLKDTMNCQAETSTGSEFLSLLRISEFFRFI